MTAGYSGTPLAKKLSLKDGMRVWREGMPDSVAHEIASEGLALDLLTVAEAPIDAAHVFVTEPAMLEERLRQLMPLLSASGFIWVAGPRRHRRSRPTSPRTRSVTSACRRAWSM
ncbi:hypothetical protein [Sphingomonas telluris]|uniref:hypothetical protein n=1 Tax=Sphingomonas telluris TaxID=2907998 RepID=UPI00344E7C9D